MDPLVTMENGWKKLPSGEGRERERGREGGERERERKRKNSVNSGKTIRNDQIRGGGLRGTCRFPPAPRLST